MAFKYRIYPSKNQKKTIDEWIHDCWWFYRYVLHHYEDDYRAARQNFHREVLTWYYRNSAYHPNWYEVSGKPKIPKEYYPRGAPLRHQGKGELSTYKLLQKAKNLRPHLRLLPAIVLQEVLERVAHAFDKFWKEGGGYPRYPKNREYRSITWTQTDSISLDESPGLLYLSKFPGLLRIKYHRPVIGKIKRANISRDILGQYYVSLMCEFESSPLVVIPNRILGIDMNIKQLDEESRSFITLSTGEHVDIPRWYTIYEQKLGKIQKKMAKCESGSTDWQRYNRHVKHLYEDVQNKRNEWLHTLTHRLATDYDYVGIEDMPLTGFHKRRKDWQAVSNDQLHADRGLRKAWTETPFGEFRRQLEYKMKDRLIPVDPKNTTRLCHTCGYLNDTLTLSIRQWTCPQCGTFHDRDANAAMNIRDRALVFISNPIKRQPEKTSKKIKKNS